MASWPGSGKASYISRYSCQDLNLDNITLPILLLQTRIRSLIAASHHCGGPFLDSHLTLR